MASGEPSSDPVRSTTRVKSAIVFSLMVDDSGFSRLPDFAAVHPATAEGIYPRGLLQPLQALAAPRRHEKDRTMAKRMEKVDFPASQIRRHLELPNRHLRRLAPD